ncbi:hypothetical protein I302_107412 [Kwoniella bestiolae CBS 10118]|uniref:Peptidase S8/S53 domain-containing protein n=1 Tax=Kwoniella bestiolae CBS 10118 TaxID=1296100 RepID=A0A1B9FYL2_9TREE|nr:hypothetical protein I302_06848 [Kwoniella bestiolae CBS 10118]OCF23863.1 hypothetical protein I302_06848 [Kwoniella bestiolae CBS 10118]
MAEITINSISIDPYGEHRSSDAASTQYIYIRTTRPLTRDQKWDLLESFGVEILELVQPSVYLCRYWESNLNAIRNLPFVDVANCYHDSFKVSPLVSSNINSMQDDEKRPFDLMLHRQANISAHIIQEIRDIAGVDPKSVDGTPNVITVTATKQAIETIKRIDVIRTVALRVPQSVHDTYALADMHAIPFSKSGNVYTGGGQSVLINDTGFDKGIGTDIHPAFANRIAALTVSGNGTHIPSDVDGHGTHVAGSIGGFSISQSMGGTMYGSAPGATMVIQSMIDANGEFNPLSDFWSLLSPSYDKYDVRISNNSWGQDWKQVDYQIPYAQNTHADTLDNFVWSAPDMIVCVSAGNEGMGNGGSQISGAAAAKNCITVGATFSSRPSHPNDFRFDPDQTAAGDPSIAAPFSSKGPTAEGRIKPDMAAPGVAILSTASRHHNFLKKANDSFGISNDPLYFFLTGTSQSTALVSGCCAVIREMLVANGFPETSAAAVKAILINGALAHGETRDDGSHASVEPDNVIGWGRVNLYHALKVPQKVSLRHWEISADYGLLDCDLGTIREGGRYDISLSCCPRKKNLKVTLVWTDPPGALIQNPLGLNVFDDTSQPSKLLANGYDSRETTDRRPENNVQQIILHGLEGVQIRVQVAADWDFATILEYQRFALVWYLFD